MTTRVTRSPPTLATARLVLRPLAHADVPAIFAIYSHPIVMRYWSRPPMTHLVQARRLVSTARAGYRTGESLSLGIELVAPHAPEETRPRRAAGMRPGDVAAPALAGRGMPAPAGRDVPVPAPGLVGTCTLFAFHAASRRAEMGYALGHAHWGHGIMNEALVRLVTYAFDDLGLHRLEADIDPANAASARTLLRLGFVREGRLRERWIVSDTISDSEIYGLLRHEWGRAAPPSA